MVGLELQRRGGIRPRPRPVCPETSGRDRGCCGLRRGRAGASGPRGMRPGLGRLALGVEDATEVVVGFGEVGLELQGLRGMRPWPRPACPDPSGRCRGCSGRGRRRAGASSPLRNSATASAGLPSSDRAQAEVAVGQVVVGIELHGRAVFGHGLGQLALGPKGVAEVEVGPGVVGLELQGPRNSASASAGLPWAPRAMPRSYWAAE